MQARRKFWEAQVSRFQRMWNRRNRRTWAIQKKSKMKLTHGSKLANCKKLQVKTKRILLCKEIPAKMSGGLAADLARRLTTTKARTQQWISIMTVWLTLLWLAPATSLFPSSRSSFTFLSSKKFLPHIFLGLYSCWMYTLTWVRMKLLVS